VLLLLLLPAGGELEEVHNHLLQSERTKSAAATQAPSASLSATAAAPAAAAAAPVRAEAALHSAGPTDAGATAGEAGAASLELPQKEARLCSMAAAFQFQLKT